MHRAGKQANASFIPNLTDRPEMYKRIEAKKGKKENISLECVIEELWYFSLLYLVRGRGELRNTQKESDLTFFLGVYENIYRQETG